MFWSNLRWSSIKKLFLKISQYSQENTSKTVGLMAFNFIKKRLQLRCFYVNIEKFFKTTYFEEHLRTTAAVRR